jgi:dCMP deaminase
MPFTKTKAIKYYKLAREMADLFSKDPSTKVGSIFLAPESLMIRTCGFNGMPRGIDETRSERWERPGKYLWCEHSERNAIYNAAREGVGLEGSIAVVTLMPCVDCARALIQVGVKTLVTVRPDMSDEKWARWGESFAVAREMFEEVGLDLVLLESDEVV